MKKTRKLLLSLLCLTTIFASGFSLQAKAVETGDAPDSIRVYGTISDSSTGRITLIRQDHNMNGQDLVITISDNTRVIDAVTGFPADQNSFKKGETVYAYISPAMTLSLPPMTNASLVLTNIPADYKVPEYVTSDSLTVNADGVSGQMTGTSKTTYTIPAGATIIPYLTRNMVTIHDLAKGSTCLIWTEASSDTATKIVVFPREHKDGSDDGLTAYPQTGWVQEGSDWYYNQEDGSRQKGWLLDNGSWYYLDAETGMMRTGFVTVDGNTYYMNASGKMQTKSISFTPDENGILR